MTLVVVLHFFYTVALSFFPLVRLFSIGETKLRWNNEIANYYSY